MLNTFTTTLSASTIERITLLLNHVITSEPIASTRLKTHAHCSIELAYAKWPTMLPALPELVFQITPAGLLEWLGSGEQSTPVKADLKISVNAANPMSLIGQWLVGTRPQISIEGNSALAADISWLIENLRWDIEDDLAKIIGAGMAHQLCTVGRRISTGFTKALHTLQKLTPLRSTTNA
jgi:ubiquinone biosynthesis accessory factor UbiJ